MYRHLDERRIRSTLDTLSQRIEERFPDSGLYRVSRELIEVARQTESNVAFLRQPYMPVRLAAIAAVTLLIGTFVTAVWAGLAVVLSGSGEPVTLAAGVSETLQGVEALVNDVVFLGIAVWFIMTIETRIKRRRALRAMHELRSISHVIDMHQLTKDPERTLSQQADTKSSPVRELSVEQLGRYLDYCSELLSVISKLAALYVQNMNDPIILEAVAEVETLSGGLSSKIWQKITLLDRLRSEPRPPAGPAAGPAVQPAV